MMRIILSKTNLILVIIIALVICTMAHPYITNGLIKNSALLINPDTKTSQSENSEKLNMFPITNKISIIEVIDEIGHINQEEMMEVIYISSGEVTMFGLVWLALYLLTRMLSFYISFAYIKGWLIKVSQITCNKARLNFLHLKSGVKYKPSYKYLLTICTLHSN